MHTATQLRTGAADEAGTGGDEAGTRGGDKAGQGTPAGLGRTEAKFIYTFAVNTTQEGKTRNKLIWLNTGILERRTWAFSAGRVVNRTEAWRPDRRFAHINPASDRD